MSILYDAAGIIGVIIMLAAYIMLQADKIKSNQLIYPTANLIGAGLIVISLLKDWNLSAFLIEACWMVISLYGIWNILRKKGAK